MNGSAVHPPGSTQQQSMHATTLRTCLANDPEIEETRLYINAQGLLNASATPSLNDLASSSTQIIILDGINKTLSELVNNGNLVWQAPVL